MRSSNFIFVLLGLLLCSCGSKGVVERVDTFFTPDEYKIVRPTVDTTKTLTLEELPIEVMGTRDIAAKDSLLFVVTSNKAAFASIVNLNTNRVVAQVAPAGRGPGDFLYVITPKQFWTNKKGELIIGVFDRLAYKPINITKSIREQGSFVEFSKPYEEIYNAERGHGEKVVITLKNQYFIFQNISYRDAREEKFFPPRFIIKTKDEQYDFDIYKDIPTSEDDSMLPFKLSGRNVRVKPDLTKVVEVNGRLDYINIIDIERRYVTSIIEPSTPRLDEVGKMDLFAALKDGAIDVSVTDEHILILYDGRTKDDMLNGMHKLASLRLYDWNGNFIKAMRLPQIGVDKMAYVESSKTAYFLDIQEEKFYKCDLSEFMK